MYPFRRRPRCPLRCAASAVWSSSWLSVPKTGSPTSGRGGGGYLGLTQGGLYAPSAPGGVVEKGVRVGAAIGLAPASGRAPVGRRPRLGWAPGWIATLGRSRSWGAALGDQRRRARLVKSAARVAKTMGKPVTATPESDPTAVRVRARPNRNRGPDQASRFKAMRQGPPAEVRGGR